MRTAVVLVVLLGAAHAKIERCGMPANLYFLPDYAQDEIKAIWKSWQRGTPCDKELQIQADIMSVLATDDDKQPLSHDAPNSSNDRLTASTLDDYLDDVADTKNIASSKFQANKQNRPKTFDYEFDDDKTTIDDVTMLRFNTAEAPFLRSAPKQVKDAFMRVWKDDDIPSDSLRAHKTQMLAVSLLNAEQLALYNSWATKRRRVLRAREQEMSGLSRAARRALRNMSVQRDEPVKVHPAIKSELREFAERLNRRRTKKLF